MKLFSQTTIFMSVLQCTTIDAVGRRMKGGLRGQTIFQEPSEPNEPISYTEINSQENDSITYIKFDGQDMPVFGRDIEPNMDIINQVLKERLGITEDENFTLDDDDQVVIP